MKKQKIIVLILSLLTMCASYASFEQKIKVCVSVDGKGVLFPFKAVFHSSDVFDSSRGTQKTESGTNCVAHTYKKGPKSILLEVYLSSFSSPSDLFLIPDQNCNYLGSTDRAFLASTYQQTTKANEDWNFSITRIRDKIFMVSCNHESY